jgi:hypothetical protein
LTGNQLAKTMNNAKPIPATPSQRFGLLAVLAITLIILFWRSFLPDYVHFSNDGPLGQQNSAWRQLPAAMTGSWYDLNDVGSSVGALAPTLTSFLCMILSPVSFSKFFAPCT